MAKTDASSAPKGVSDNRPATQPNKADSGTDYRGFQDSRPSNADRIQSAK